MRETISKALQGAGFAFDPANAAHRQTMYEGRYTIYRLPYEPAAEGRGALRPEIQIETARVSAAASGCGVRREFVRRPGFQAAP